VLESVAKRELPTASEFVITKPVLRPKATSTIDNRMPPPDKAYFRYKKGEA